MTGQNGDYRLDIIQAIAKHLKNSVPVAQFEIIKDYIPRYFGFSSLNDLLERSVEDLSGTFLSHWNFIYQRKPGEAKVQILNPQIDKDKWESTHSIIEIAHDDTPFLVDSVRMELNRRNIQIHFMIHFGGLKVKRNKKHLITEILPVGVLDLAATSEAPIYIEIDRQSDPAVMRELTETVLRILSDVKASVVDWHKMVNRAEDALLELEQNPPAIDAAELVESKDFLRWLINNNFTFLGSRDYKLIGDRKSVV